jgi:hypothetical protein
VFIDRPKVTCASADSIGRYRISVPKGLYVITAEASGFKPGSARAGEPIPLAADEQRTALDIVLEHGGVGIAGAVLDVTGGPIVGATIRVTRIEEPRLTVLGESDHDGRFALWALPGPVVFTASANGYVPGILRRAIPTVEVVIELTPGSSVQGQVVSAADNVPVADVEVRAVALKRAFSSSANLTSVSDSVGSFDIRGLEPGVYTLFAQGGGWTGSSNGSVRIGLADTVSNVVVVVSSAPQVSGRVLLRSDASPCDRGVVNLGPTGSRTFYDPPSVPFDPDPAHRSHVPSISVPIEADGTVHFRAVPAGTYHVEVKCVDHNLVEGPTLIEIASANILDLVWRVDAGIGLIVHMLDEAGNPLPQAISWLTSAAGPVRMALVADGNGRFEHPRMLYAGTFTITPGHGGSDGDSVNVELREGMEKAEVTVRFKGRCSIIATVRGSKLEPIDDMTVRAVSVIRPSQLGGTTPDPANSAAPADDPKAPRERPYDAVALGNGRFRIDHLPPGKYRVQAADGVNPPFEAADVAGGIFEVSRGVVNATITVDRDATIHGRVVDSSGQPIPDTWVSASCKTAAAEALPGPSFGRRFRPFAAKRTISSRDGQFTLRDLESTAICSLRAEQPFGMDGLKDNVSAGTDDVVVTLTSVEDATANASSGGASLNGP